MELPKAVWKSSVPAIILFFLSGFAGLVYQVIWLRQFTLIFGATAYASSAVLSTFMGGLALGASWVGRRADDWLDEPLTTYGKLELGIAAYAALIPWRSETPDTDAPRFRHSVTTFSLCSSV